MVSNFLALDEEDRITGIKGEVIHTYNKNETAIKNTDYYDLVRDRSNVILMGDNIGNLLFKPACLIYLLFKSAC